MAKKKPGSGFNLDTGQSTPNDVDPRAPSSSVGAGLGAAKPRGGDTGPGFTTASSRSVYGRQGPDKWEQEFLRKIHENPAWSHIKSADQWAEYTGYEIPGWLQDEGGLPKVGGKTVAAMAGSDPFDYFDKAPDDVKLQLLNWQLVSRGLIDQPFSSLAEAQKVVGPLAFTADVARWQQQLGSPFVDPSGGTPPWIESTRYLGANSNTPGEGLGFTGGFWNMLASELGKQGIDKTFDQVQSAWEGAQENLGKVPWLEGTLGRLQEQGIPWETISTQLSSALGHPGVNLNDPTQPLFRGGTTGSDALVNGSLPGIYGDFGPSAGPYLSGLTAQEFSEQLFPLWYQYHYDQDYRTPGNPAFEAGLKPQGAYYVGDGSGNASGNQYVYSPVSETPSYERFLAYQYPGRGGPGESQIPGQPQYQQLPDGTFIPIPEVWDQTPDTYQEWLHWQVAQNAPWAPWLMPAEDWQRLNWIASHPSYNWNSSGG